MIKLEKLRRYIVYITGLYVFALGIALVARSSLGATPVSSWAYTMSINTSLTYGTYSFIIHLAMIAYQIIILYRHGLDKEFFNILLQIPFSFLFSLFIDVNMLLTDFVNPSTNLECYAVLAIACFIHAFGVFMQVSARITMMSAEAFVYYTCRRWNLKFWKTKIKFDISMVILAILTSLLFNFSFTSIITVIREGTLLDALFVGRLYRMYAAKISIINRFISWGKSNTTETFL